MKRVKYNENWKFWKDRDSFALVWSVPDYAKDITLPHDAMLEDPVDPNSPNGTNTGFRSAEIYDYVRLIDVPSSWKDETVFLEFEGVYMNAFVYVNGQFCAKNNYGYTTFRAPLNDFVKYGETNEIRVQVRAGAMTNSRWYSGAGIYRDVYLLEAGKTYIVPESLRIKTEEVSEEMAVLKLSLEIKSREANPQQLIAKTVITDAAGNEVAKEKTRVVVFDNGQREITQRIAVEGPNLWSDENPYLYKVSVSLYRMESEEELTELDAEEVITGIRKIQVDAKRGFRVNSRVVNLRGACIHLDSGLLGAATYEDAQYREVRKLKEAGFNAIRMAHHPMAPAMLRACDELGVYVMDETFDMWSRLKSNYDYGLFFKEQWAIDVASMVRKDYNHPSVVIYSVGNEIPEIGTPHGSKQCADICALIRSIDDTRYLTAGINGVFAAGDAVQEMMSELDIPEEQKTFSGNVNQFLMLMDSHLSELVQSRPITERLERGCAPLDIAGYNYMTARYEGDQKTYPNRVIVGSETYPPQIAENWDLITRLPNVIGDFTWTGWDYLGEAGGGIPTYAPGVTEYDPDIPPQLSYGGDIDITGFRRPASYYRERVFGLCKTPFIAVQDPRHYGEILFKSPWMISDATERWTWKGLEGKPVIVEVYSMGDEVELYLNGDLLEKKSAGKAAGYRTLFELTYEPGELAAVAYEDGKEIGRSSLLSAGEERCLVLTQEKYLGSPHKEQELVFVDVRVVDDKGTIAADDYSKITLTTKGDVEVLGFGSASPKPRYNFNEGISELFEGRAQIIVRKPKQEAILTIESESGLSGSVVIR